MIINYTVQDAGKLLTECERLRRLGFNPVERGKPIDDMQFELSADLNGFCLDYWTVAPLTNFFGKNNFRGILRKPENRIPPGQI